MDDETPIPTSGDMELLSLLWEHGPMSLSEVHGRLARDVAYTTVQTRLNRLVQKGLATRNKVGQQPLKYAAAVEAERIGASRLDHLVERVTRGSIVPLVAHLVKAAPLSEDELNELRELIQQAEQNSRRPKRGGAK